jgi:tetratricopeptide (TPR) repeat protein
MTVYAKLDDNTSVGQARPELPFAVGSFYKRSGFDGQAVEAFELAIKFGAAFKRDDIEIYQARAYTETASILAAQNKPGPALEAYKRALAIYDNLVKAAYGINGSKEQADAEGDRVRVIIKALESGLSRAGPK